MTDLTVPQLKLFSQPPTYNYYRHSSKRYHHGYREHKRSSERNKYGEKVYRYEHAPMLEERLLTRETPIAHLVDRLLPNVIDEVPYVRHVQPIPIPIARPIPIPAAIPIPVPHFLPLPHPIPHRSRYRLDTYYEMSKMVLNDAVGNPMLQTFKPRKSRTDSSSRYKNSSFSIIRYPYLTDGTVQRRYEKSEEKKQYKKEEPKRVQEPEQPRVTPKHTPKGITVISASDHHSPKPPQQNIVQPPQPTVIQPAAPTLYAFNELFSLFKDIIEHYRLNMEHLREEHEKYWLSMLEAINKLKREEQQKEMRKRIKEWKRRVFPLEYSIVYNVSMYTYINNDSTVRRDLREIDQKKLQFQNRLNYVLYAIDYFDFSLERNMKTKQYVNVSEIVRLKNEDIQLHRYCIGKINNLIRQYDSKSNGGSVGFSYFY